ncbi:MAG: hypothetical protein ACI86M_002586 [Saprospiraceae bacterium]|jgi:hypothetical protein
MTILIILFKIFLLTQHPFTLQEGDLLFQDVDCGPFCEAVEKVTEGYQGADLSHVGMVIKTETEELQVIEATTKGVILTTISVFLEKSLDENGKPKVLVGRMKEVYRSLIPQAKRYAKALLGKKYDTVFDINNDTYYCSELVYEAFKNANGDEPIFKLFPMTFVDPDTEKTFGIWVDYYLELGADIPEGELGLNPGGMSRSEKLDIIYNYQKGNSRR